MTLNASFFNRITLCSVIFFASSMAQETKASDEQKPRRHYDVEIILFKNLKVPKANEKVLPAQAPFLGEQFISFANAENIKAAAKLEFIVAQENTFRLLDIANKIVESERYKLLKHMAWRQPGLAKKDALAVQIRTGEKFGNHYSSIDSSVIPFKESIQKEAFNSGFNTAILGDNNVDKSADKTTKIERVWYELEGKITISLARYLHAYVDLVLRIPRENKLQIISNFETPEQSDQHDDFSLSSATLNNFSFKEHRRMRSRKLHFLDHPEVGMLILISP